MYEQTLYSVLKDVIPTKVLKSKNKSKSWKYGYNKEYDIIIISKTGQIGQVYSIQGLIIALPKEEDVANTKKWTRQEYPKELKRINNIFDWRDLPDDFKNKWHNYIDNEFKKREEGYWFTNKGIPTYITGSHYMYLQWTKIDVEARLSRSKQIILYFLGSV